jgi:hypothetical protein
VVPTRYQREPGNRGGPFQIRAKLRHRRLNGRTVEPQDGVGHHLVETDRDALRYPRIHPHRAQLASERLRSDRQPTPKQFLAGALLLPGLRPRVPDIVAVEKPENIRDPGAQ